MRLIDADALIDDIKNHLWDWETVNGITAQTVLKQTITDVENQPTISPWHMVEEPPKEDGKYVAINVKTKWWYEASYENGNWKAVDLFGQRWVVIHPTHWMPIEPPKDECNAD